MGKPTAVCGGGDLVAHKHKRYEGTVPKCKKNYKIQIVFTGMAALEHHFSERLCRPQRGRSHRLRWERNETALSRSSVPILRGRNARCVDLDRSALFLEVLKSHCKNQTKEKTVMTCVTAAQATLQTQRCDSTTHPSSPRVAAKRRNPSKLNTKPSRSQRKSSRRLFR
jgi:hypothetical protein